MIPVVAIALLFLYPLPLRVEGDMSLASESVEELDSSMISGDTPGMIDLRAWECKTYEDIFEMLLFLFW